MAPHPGARRPLRRHRTFRKDQVIVFLCSCGSRLQVPDAAAGKKSRCPKCKAAVIAPSAPSKILAGETEEDAPTRPLPIVPPPEDDEDTRPLPPAHERS